ncbi:FadD3 family acyl-CoA ligase [Halomonas sp. H5]|uniref:FadD3 family acyl-CoA ligase n=1 Tax=Halomonas sp. H5 TaxID=3423910 RepID=UPI003D369825
MSQPTTIPALLHEAAARHAGIAALEDAGERIDYAELPERAAAVARGLLAAGIAKGDRVALWAPNTSRWVLAALGIHLAGGVLVPLNTRMKGREASDILRRSGARLLFLAGDFLGQDYPALLDGLVPETLERRVLLGERDAAPLSGLTAWEAFLAEGEAVEAAAVEARAASLGPEDLSDLLFTSGTTGAPKGVMSEHGQNLRAFGEYIRVIGLRPGDRYLVINPFFHAFGYKAGWLSCLLAGATILPQAVFDAAAVLERIERERISVLPGPPTLYLSLLAEPRLAEADLSSLRVAVTGSASIPPILIRRMREELGFAVVTTAYGLTECGGLATLCDPAADAETIATTSGRAIAGTEVSIRDSRGAALAAGESGEICLRGFHVMRGYFDHPEATAEAIDAAGWLHTGDVGSLDAAGNLRITDRLKDMFIVGGFNCYPAEIEAMLVEHPRIAQCAVIGVPDERLGEVGCAFVVPTAGPPPSAESLIAWARRQMANYKAPRHMRLVERLPVNASNKVVKPALRRLFDQG